jgi:hypothetical protein
MKALQTMGLLSLSSLVAMSTEVPVIGITGVVEAGNTVRKPLVQLRETVLKRLVNLRVDCVLLDHCHKSWDLASKSKWIRLAGLSPV